MRKGIFILWVAACCFVCGLGEAGAALGPVEQIVAEKGVLPQTGRVVIRSGLSWMAEDDPLFTLVARYLSEALIQRGLVLVAVSPSDDAPYPAGTERVRGVPIPKHNGGGPRRLMSITEASARMKAMQLVREGRLPQTKFGGTKSGTTSKIPRPTKAEMIRFALSQEAGEPELRGYVTIPGRVPDEAHLSDPAVADYVLAVRFAMLWPASTSPDNPPNVYNHSGLAAGWHLLELGCYDLAPARQGKEPKRVWEATVQRVALGSYLRGTLPKMARDAVEQAKKK